jgi:hypothetical protein
MTNPIKPPVGSYVAMVFRVTGYDPDRGETPESATMARLEHVDLDGETTGWEAQQIGLYDTTAQVLSEPGGLRAIGVPVEPFRHDGQRGLYPMNDGAGFGAPGGGVDVNDALPPRCAAEWGICPDHGPTLTSSGGVCWCHWPGCGRRWDYDRLGEDCAEPGTHRVTGTNGVSVICCSVHGAEATQALDGAVVEPLNP